MSACRYFFNSDSMLYSFSTTGQRLWDADLINIPVNVSHETHCIYPIKYVPMRFFFNMNDVIWTVHNSSSVGIRSMYVRICSQAHSSYVADMVALSWTSQRGVWQVSQRSCPLREDSCCCCWGSPPLHLFFCSAAYTSQAKFIPPFAGLSFCMLHCLYCASDI